MHIAVLIQASRPTYISNILMAKSNHLIFITQWTQLYLQLVQFVEMHGNICNIVYAISNLHRMIYLWPEESDMNFRLKNKQTPSMNWHFLLHNFSFLTTHTPGWPQTCLRYDDITKACDRDARLSATAVTARAMRSDTSRVYPTDPCARSPVKHGEDMTERIRGKRRKQANPRRNQGQSVVH